MNSFLESKISISAISDNMLDMRIGPIKNKPNIPPMIDKVHIFVFIVKMPDKIVIIDIIIPIEAQILRNPSIVSIDISGDISCN